MTLTCERTRGLFHDYAAEALSAADRRDLRAHLAGCLSCRQEAARADEGLLFAFVPAPETSSADVEQVLSGVRAGIAWRKAQRRFAAVPSRHRRRGLVAAAAALVTFALAFPDLSPPRPASAPVAAAQPASRREQRASLPAPAPEELLPAADLATEGQGAKNPADATIYDWNPGSGQPRVVWIVDRSLDI